MHEVYKLPVGGHGENSISMGALALERKSPGRSVWRNAQGLCRGKGIAQLNEMSHHNLD